MATVIPDGWLEVITHCTQPGSLGPFHSLFGLTTAGGFDQTEADSISDGFAAAWQGWLPDNATYDGCTIRVGATGPVGAYATWESVSSAGPGTAAGDTYCPPAVQALIRKNTATAGRSGRGRTFVPLVEEAHVADNGALSDVEFTALQTLADAIMDAGLGGSSDGLYVLHDESIGSPVPSLVTSCLAQRMVSSQRERYRR